MTLLLSLAAQPILFHMNAFIQMLAFLSSDRSPDTRRAVCQVGREIEREREGVAWDGIAYCALVHSQAICTIASVHVAVLDPYFESICQFMLAALSDSDERVAIESCDFWKSMIQFSDTKRVSI